MVSLTTHGVKSALGCEGWWPITEHAEAQLEPTALRKISRAVAFPSLHNFMGTMISKIRRNIKIIDIVHIVPFKTVTHIPRLLCHKLCCWAQQFCCVCQWWWQWVQSTLCLLGEALKCLHVLLSTELKWDLMSISHCLAYINLTFLQKRKRKWEIELLCFLCFHTWVICHLTLSHPLLAQCYFQLNPMFPTAAAYLKSWKISSGA